MTYKSFYAFTEQGTGSLGGTGVFVPTHSLCAVINVFGRKVHLLTTVGTLWTWIHHIEYYTTTLTDDNQEAERVV